MRAWVRLLLRAWPRDFRRARGEELLAFVEEEAREAAERGTAARVLHWVRTTVDVLAGAVRLRLRPVAPPPGPRSGRGDGSLGAWLHDVRYAARSLAGVPGVTAVVALTLSLGVGMSTAIFSVVDHVLLRPLDYRAPDRLVVLSAELVDEEVGRPLFSGGDLADLRREVDALESVAGVAHVTQNLTGAGLPLQVGVGWSSGNLFEMLGVEAAVGRTYRPDDPPGTLLLTHGLWVERFGADPGAVGTTLRLDGHPHTVVGVLPADFRLHLPSFPTSVGVWKNPDRFWQNGDVWNAQGPEYGLLRVVGRLGPGADLEAVRARLSNVEADWRSRWPDYERAGLSLTVAPLPDEVVREVRPTLWLLVGAVAVVLLIACANVAALLLVRARRRRREMALRVALGASGGRVARLVLAEGLVLALLGGAGGVALAWAATRGLAALGPAIPRADAVAVDPRVLAFGLGLSLVCTVLVALVPAWGVARTPAAEGMAGGRGEAAGGRTALRGSLVVGQIALSLVLLAGSGLLTASLAELRSVEPGFDETDLLTFSVSLPGARYEWPDGVHRFFSELEERVDALPGVRSAGVGWPMPLSGSRWSSAFHGGRLLPEDQAFADYRVVSPDYFGTLGIPLVDGRLFGEGDPRHTVVVSRRVAERAWPGSAALGRTLEANPWGRGDTAFTVVGVVEDVRYSSLEEEPLGALYFDLRGWSWSDWEFHVLARSATPPGELVPAVREILASMDPEVPLADPATMESLVARQVADERFALSLMGLFSVVAAVLSLVGLYGVVSYAVGLRAREIGIRMALGSARSAISRLVLRQGLGLTAAGIGVGLAGALLLSRLLDGFLFGVEPTAPGPYLVTAGLLAGLATLAAWLPARRAARTDPTEVLRSE